MGAYVDFDGLSMWYQLFMLDCRGHGRTTDAGKSAAEAAGHRPGFPRAA